MDSVELYARTARASATGSSSQQVSGCFANRVTLGFQRNAHAPRVVSSLNLASPITASLPLFFGNKVYKIFKAIQTRAVEVR